MLKKVFSFTNLYILLWALYCLQAIYIGTSFSAILFYAPFLTINLVFFIKQFNHISEASIYHKSLIVLVLLLFFYGLFSIFWGTEVRNYHDDIVSSSRDITDALFFLCPIFVFAYLSRVGTLTKGHIRIWLPIFFLISALQYIDANKTEMLNAWVDSASLEFTNNSGYLFVGLLPCVLFLKKSWLQYVFVLACSLFALLSMKRGAIVICAVCVLLFVLTKIGTSKSSKRILAVLGCSILFALLYYAVESVLSTNQYFVSRFHGMLSGDSNGRDVISRVLVNSYLYDSSWGEMLFGIGSNGTIKICGLLAHNDWLQFLINYGILGIVLYSMYWFGFYEECKAIRFSRPDIFVPFLMCFLILFLKTFFSQSYQDIQLYISMILGYCIGQLDDRDNNRQSYENSL